MFVASRLPAPTRTIPQNKKSQLSPACRISDSGWLAASKTAVSVFLLLLASPAPLPVALWCRRIVRGHRGARHRLHLCLYRLVRYSDNERASCVYWLHCRVGLDWIAQLYGRHRQSSVSMQSRLPPVQLRW